MGGKKWCARADGVPPPNSHGGRATAKFKPHRGQGHSQAFGKNFKRPTNREDSSDLDDFLIELLAAMRSIISKNFPRHRHHQIQQKNSNSIRSSTPPGWHPTFHRPIGGMLERQQSCASSDFAADGDSAPDSEEENFTTPISEVLHIS